MAIPRFAGNAHHFSSLLKTAVLVLLLGGCGGGSSSDPTPAPNDPCSPDPFVAECPRDSDGDGVSDFDEGATTDTDGDGKLDYLESSVLDDDNDGTNNQADADDADPCIPNALATACVTGIATRPANSSCVAPVLGSADNSVTLTRIFSNISLTLPIKALQAPGDNGFWYFVEQGGIIKRVPNINSTSDAPTYISLPVATGGERGLLSMAFSPDWPTRKEFYVYYTINAPTLETRVSRIIINSDTSLPASFTEQVLLSIDQPFSNHNGGDMFFGSDGYLYVSTGDGGDANDPLNKSQTTSNLLGNILRIDVNGISYPTPAYNIPTDNPFAGNAKCGPDTNATNCPEIYAWGLRNPWRWSFDSQTDELWLGDVGQNNLEEINKIALGDNLGWRCKEGTNNFITAGCNLASLTDPVHEYPHTNGNVSVTGGFVYRGSNMTGLVGHYLFADYLSGIIWGLTNVGGSYIVDELLDSTERVSSFAQDNDGELYIISHSRGHFLRIEEGSSSGGDNIPTSLVDTGCVAVADPSQPASGLIPYQPNARFWSDNADKLRWLALPDGTQVDPADDTEWAFPPGTVTVKNFVVENQLIETRLFMQHPNGTWAGYTYEWDDAETTATRVIGGKLRNLTHTAAPQQWIYPSEGECLQCHTEVDGYVLGVNTPQLNGEFLYPDSGVTDNQLETLNHIDLFDPDVVEPVSALPSVVDPEDTAQTLNDRARAYLHTNCASCHQPGGGTPAAIDLRYETTLAASGTCDVDPLLSSLGISNAKIIAPGDAARSVLLNRMNRRDGDGMPPIGSNIIDSAGVSLIEQWINSLGACP